MRTVYHYLHEGQNINLLFLMRQKYSIFYSEKLHADTIQHCLHHGNFLKFLKCLESIF
jgi:hypothetical protein